MAGPKRMSENFQEWIETNSISEATARRFEGWLHMFANTDSQTTGTMFSYYYKLYLAYLDCLNNLSLDK